MGDDGTMLWHRATILSRRKLSPTVTGLTLQINSCQPSTANPDEFTFLPGCWVDFKPLPSSTWNPNGGKCIGGYSLTSIPQSLPEFELAVQSSRHPVANWVTAHSQPNDVVDVRVGGSFTYKGDYYNSPKNSTHGDDTRSEAGSTNQRLLFIAGGVGINPPYSMIRQWHADQTSIHNNNSRPSSRAILLYSGKSVQDFLFINELNNLIKEKPDQFRVICTTTKPNEQQENLDQEKYEDGKSRGNSIGVEFRKGRIDIEMIKEAVCWLNNSNSNIANNETSTHIKGYEIMIADAAYICGPPGMPETMMNILADEKLVQSTDNVHFEKWW